MKRKLLILFGVLQTAVISAQVTVTPASATQCAGSVQQLSATAPGMGQATLFSENFEGGTLGGLTATVIAGTVTANSQWTNRTSPYATPTTVWNPTINSGSKFALSNSDYSGANVNTAMESGVLNTTGYTSLSLTFRHFYSDYSDVNDFAYVEVSINGGTDWTTVETYTTDIGSASNFAAATVSFNNYLNQANFKFRLRYKATWNDGWAVDDIVLSGMSSSVASFTWSPMAGLYTDAAATIPYTGTAAATVYAKPQATTTYTASYTNGPDTFTGTAAITVTDPVAPSFADDAPIVCAGAILSSINQGNSNLVWYASATGGASLLATSVLTDGTYYAAQLQGNCESSQRTEVNVTVNTVEPPTGDAVQSFCNEGTIGDLVAEGASVWYSASSGGTALAATTPLVNLQTYYAAQVADGCESVERLAVQAILSFAALDTPADVVVCDSYTLPELEYGNYFSEAGGNGTAYAEGETVTASGVMYVYANDFSNPDCVAETSFMITISVAGPLTGDQDQTIQAASAAEATVGDLVLFSDTGGLIVWYASYEDAADGENALDPNTPITEGHQYFATVTFGQCTSAPYGVTAHVVLGTAGFGENSFRYSPNPVTGTLAVVYHTEINSIEVYNMLGQNVLSLRPNAAETTIDMSGLSVGTYVLKVIAENLSRTVKIIKE